MIEVLCLDTALDITYDSHAKVTELLRNVLLFGEGEGRRGGVFKFLKWRNSEDPQSNT